MKFKSLLTKFIPGKKKKSPEDRPGEEKTEVIAHEISFERRETRIEEPGAVGEIDLYVNDDKTNIHTLAPVTKIGRDPAQSDIVISELIVSKLHCIIFSQGERFFIKDNDSTNGVYVNNEKVAEQELKNGDTILLGKKGTVKLIFHLRR
jgi:pSer/pThr/pTyr-binding forkhead associated (FHA) protein